MLEVDKLIIKPLELQELIVALKRLSKFKYPNLKKDRVYKEILIKNTINPKISLKNIYKYPSIIIDSLVQLIWNYSVEMHSGISEYDIILNYYIAYEQTKVFSSEKMLKDLLSTENIFKTYTPGCLSSLKNVAECTDEDLEKDLLFLLKENDVNISLNLELFKDFNILDKFYMIYNTYKPLNISGLLDFIQLDIEQKELLPNIKRLIWINNFIKTHKINSETDHLKKDLEIIYLEAEKFRKKESLRYPEKLLIIVEGATEEKLLPQFAKKAGIDFDKNGIQLIAAGGKNQVAKIYKEYHQKIKIPVLIILDADAKKIADEILSLLPLKDRIFIIPDGEFEDTLTVDLILNSINSFYGLTTEVKRGDIDLSMPMTNVLHNLWKEKGLGEFNKVNFAEIMARNIANKDDISYTMTNIIDVIKEML